MRFYISVEEAYKEILRDLAEMGVVYQSATVQDKNVKENPDFITKELIGYSYTLTQWKDARSTCEKYGINMRWLDQENTDRLDQTLPQKNPGNAFRFNRSFWEQFLRDGRFSYSYPERWHEQIEYVIEELERRPNTRQAIMTMYDRHQDMMNWGGRDRVPCSVSYQFLLRDSRLDVIYNQRSCDYVQFFLSDVYLTIQLMIYIADSIEVEPGRFVHFLGSLHAFQKDLKGVF